MRESLNVIQQEHRNLGTLLTCLKDLVEEIETKKVKPDFEIFGEIFDYIGSFLDRYHHPKEDSYLFKALRRRDGGAAAALDALQAEHEREPRMLAKMWATLEDYRRDGARAFPAFRDAVHAYAEFERAHARAEERDIFPLAERVLTDADWAEIDAAFLTNRDPLFGAALADRFRRLYGEIAQRVPAPFGFGQRWERSG